MLNLIKNLEAKLADVKECVENQDYHRADAILIGYRLDVELLQRELWLNYTKSGEVC